MYKYRRCLRWVYHVESIKEVAQNACTTVFNGFYFLLCALMLSFIEIDAIDSRKQSTRHIYL